MARRENSTELAEESNMFLPPSLGEWLILGCVLHSFLLSLSTDLKSQRPGAWGAARYRTHCLRYTYRTKCWVTMKKEVTEMFCLYLSVPSSCSLDCKAAGEDTQEKFLFRMYLPTSKPKTSGICAHSVWVRRQNTPGNWPEVRVWAQRLASFCDWSCFLKAWTGLEVVLFYCQESFWITLHKLPFPLLREKVVEVFGVGRGKCFLADYPGLHSFWDQKDQ